MPSFATEAKLGAASSLVVRASGKAAPAPRRKKIAKSTDSKTPQALVFSRYFPNPRCRLLDCQKRLRCPLANGHRPSSKWRASHGRVDTIENAQAFKIRHSTDCDRIGEVLNLALGVGECTP